MKPLLILFLCCSLMFCCQRILEPTAVPAIPGSRNYVWQLDTLDMPMNRIFSVSGASPRDVWAVGPGGTQYDRLQHYDGVQWSTYTKEVIWCDAGTLYAFSTDNVWMGGGAGWLAHGAGMWHFNGTEWSQNYVYDIKGSYLMEVCDIWGPNPNDLYACGMIVFKDGGNEDVRGFVLHYNGRQWKEVVRGPSNSQFLKIRKERNQIYVMSFGSGGGSAAYETEIFYELKNSALIEIYSNASDNMDIKNLNYIAGKAYFVIGENVYRCLNGVLVKQFSFHHPQFSYSISGRSEMDIFLSMKDGIAHYNGADIEYLYKFPVEYMGQVKDPLIFSNEVFFCVDNPLGAPNAVCLILHGRIKE